MKLKNLKNFFKGGKAKGYTLMLLAFAMLQNSAFAGNKNLVWEEPTQIILKNLFQDQWQNLLVLLL